MKQAHSQKNNSFWDVTLQKGYGAREGLNGKPAFLYKNPFIVHTYTLKGITIIYCHYSQRYATIVNFRVSLYSATKL